MGVLIRGIITMSMVVSALGQASTLVQYQGLDAGFVGLLAVGWQQATEVQDVTISVPLYHIPPASPGGVVVYLTTSIGSGTTPADQIAASGAVVPTSLTSMEYVFFSGLDLSPGAYYLVIDDEFSNGVSWAGGVAGYRHGVHRPRLYVSWRIPLLHRQLAFRL